MTRTARGWLLGVTLMVGPWSLSNVLFAFAAQIVGVSPAVFAGTSFIGASAVLLAIGGRGPLVRETLRAPETWIYSATNLANYVTSLVLLKFLAATEVSLTQRLSLVVAVVAGIVSARRLPSRMQTFASLAVAGAVALTLADLPRHLLPITLILVAVSALLQATRIFAAERHKPYDSAILAGRNLRDQARVVGMVMGGLGLLFICAIGAWNVVLPEPLNVGDSPTGSFARSAGLGLSAGLIFVAPIRLLEFATTNRIKTRGFLALAALTPAATLLWERALAPWTGLPLTGIGGLDFLAVALVLLGGGVASLDLVRESRLRLAAVSLSHRLDDE